MIILAFLLTGLAGAIAVFPATIITMLFPGILISIIPERYKFIIIYFVQLTCYALADFAGIFVGYLILKSQKVEHLLPYLFIPVIFSTISFIMNKQFFLPKKPEYVMKPRKLWLFPGILWHA